MKYLFPALHLQSVCVPCFEVGLFLVSAAQVQVLRYSTEAQTWLGMCFVPLPGLRSSDNQVLGQYTVPDAHCILITSPLPATQFPRCIARVLSQVCVLCVSSGELISGSDPPGRCQLFRIPERLG